MHAPGSGAAAGASRAIPHAAEDLMQEVFVRFITRFPEPPADMNVAGYLNATARNVLWKQLRDDHEIADGEIESSAGPDDDLEVDPERATLLGEQQRIVRRCSAALTGRQRRALTLREIEGHSYAEIGSDLGIGTDAVAQVISRARARLRVAVRRAHVDLDQLSPECRAMLGPLSDYLDGHASATSAEIEAHLKECASCRHSLASFETAGSRLRGTLPLVPFTGLLARIGDAVRLGGGGPFDAVRAGALVLAAAAAIGGGGMYAATELTTSPPARSSAAHAPWPFRCSARSTSRACRAACADHALASRRGPAGRSGAASGTGDTRARRTTSADVGSSEEHRDLRPEGDPATPVVAPTAAPAVDAPATTPAVRLVSKPAVDLPVTVPKTPAVTTPVDPGSDVTRTASKVAPVVGKVVDPVVTKVVDPIVTPGGHTGHQGARAGHGSRHEGGRPRRRTRHQGARACDGSRHEGGRSRHRRCRARDRPGREGRRGRAAPAEHTARRHDACRHDARGHDPRHHDAGDHGALDQDRARRLALERVRRDLRRPQRAERSTQRAARDRPPALLVVDVPAVVDARDDPPARAQAVQLGSVDADRQRMSLGQLGRPPVLEGEMPAERRGNPARGPKCASAPASP